MKTHYGNAILGAAIIDDILGIIALTIITSVTDPSVRISVVLGKVAAFFVFAIIAGLIISNTGKSEYLPGSAFAGSIVVMVVITTSITPILLKVVYRSGCRC